MENSTFRGQKTLLPNAVCSTCRAVLVLVLAAETAISSRCHDSWSHLAGLLQPDTHKIGDRQAVRRRQHREPLPVAPSSRWDRSCIFSVLVQVPDLHTQWLSTSASLPEDVKEHRGHYDSDSC